MSKNRIRLSGLFIHLWIILSLSMSSNMFTLGLSAEPDVNTKVIYKKLDMKPENDILNDYKVPVVEKEPEVVEEPEVIEEVVNTFSEYDVNLLSLVALGEAEGEGIEGQRLVIDSVLNRVDSPQFPNTIYDVIYQPHQYDAMWNGRVDRVIITDEVRAIAIEELTNRSNYDVIYFRTDYYSSYGTPLFNVGRHFFSGH